MSPKSSPVFCIIYVFLGFTESYNVLSESNVNPNESKKLVLNPFNSENNDAPEDPPGQSSWWGKGKRNKCILFLYHLR